MTEEELDWSFPEPYEHKPNCGWCHSTDYKDFNETTWHVVIGKEVWTSTMRSVNA